MSYPLASLGRTSSLLALASVIGVLALGCDVAPSEPATSATPDAFHIGFPIEGGHLATQCEDCHVVGALEQGLTTDDPSGFVTAIGTSCDGCHSDTRDEIFPNGHKGGETCDGSGCHASADDCWRSVRGACIDVPTGEPPPPIGHEGERAILFPLEGPHAIEACADCHTGASDDEQRGGSTNCEMCHDRPADHKPAVRNGGPDDIRDCKACHATEAADGKLLAGPDWTADAVEHDLYWPHNRVDLGTGDLNPSDEVAVACITCHTTPGVQDAAGATCDACHVAVATEAGHVQLSPNHNFYPGACHECHPRGDNR